MVKVRESGNGLKVGTEVHRFVVLGWQFRIRYEWYFVGRCACGRIKVVRIGHILAGRVRSCGCLNSEIASDNFCKLRTHRQTGTPLYRLWTGMKIRCASNAPDKARNYKNRGIRVCDRWAKSFEAFRDWALANGYRPGLQIDRFPNKDGNYEPKNCRFVTCKVNSRNSRSNHLVSAWGETKTVVEWIEDDRCGGITAATLCKRLAADMDPETAISQRSKKWKYWERKSSRSQQSLTPASN